MSEDATYWMKWECPCRETKEWLIRVDRNMNQMQFYCQICNTLIKTEISTIQYSA